MGGHGQPFGAAFLLLSEDAKGRKYLKAKVPPVDDVDAEEDGVDGFETGAQLAADASEALDALG